MKTNRYFEYLLVLIQVLPLIFIAYSWNQLPDQIPTHWNLKGDIDSYGGKWAIFLGPGISLAVYLILVFAPRIDPKRSNYKISGKAWQVVRLGLQIFLSLLSMFVCYASLGKHVDVGMYVQLAILGLFLVLGNYMGNIRHNYFVGVRTPWTLSSEEIWKHTHRFTGQLWVWATLPMFAVVLLWPKEEWPFIVYVGIIAVIPIVYSYILFRNKKQQQ